MTEEDIEKVVARLEERLRERFYQDLGRGVWGLAWKFIIVVAIVLAAYGAGVSGWLPRK